MIAIEGLFFIGLSHSAVAKVWTIRGWSIMTALDKEILLFQTFVFVSKKPGNEKNRDLLADK